MLKSDINRGNAWTVRAFVAFQTWSLTGDNEMVYVLSVCGKIRAHNFMQHMPDELTPPVVAPEPKKEAAIGTSPLFQDLLPVAALWFAVVVGVVFVALFFKEPARPAPLGVDKNGVQIINLNKKQVTNRTADGKPLNEPEVHAVFRWAVEHPQEVARLSPEQKANIIRALNE